MAVALFRIWVHVASEFLGIVGMRLGHPRANQDHKRDSAPARGVVQETPVREGDFIQRAEPSWTSRKPEATHLNPINSRLADMIKRW